MKMSVKIKVDTPMGFFCKNCTRKEKDFKGRMFCTLFNRFVYMRRGDYMKCLECVMAQYDELQKGE